MRAAGPGAAPSPTTYPSKALRWWRTAPWSRSPLLRLSDRIEGVVRLLVIVVVLAAVPVCGAIGTAAYTGAQAEIRAENATKTQVTAVLTEPPTHVTSVVDDATDGRYEAVVRWNEGGYAGEASTDVERTARPADHVTLWLGPGGRPTTPPVPVGVAAWRGTGLALGFMVQIVVCAMAAVRVTTWLVRRRHEARWAREWRTVGRPIGQGNP
ncbi:Rv1733c family protein [Nocardia blacklockiae]|uniref:Rv1733c family protein n=1 Tax=Nocardia blacklockiae TaxID=480036 RepID=UPI001895C8B8|nr:hypothetical protein [Nocardia blacklockiae]MBF6176637.1 hypothetical protein [Nocardia blacklockiae]